MENVKLIASVTTGRPMVVYCPRKEWMFARRVCTNVKAYFNGESYWVNIWNAKRVN